MRIDVQVKLNLKIPEAQKKIEEATRLGLRDTIVAIHNQVVQNAPYRKTPPRISTGHNARSIASEVSGMGIVQRGADAEPERSVDDNKLEAACYSTSGYGGYLETGTWKMAARPYFRPALDTHSKDLKTNIKRHLE